MDIGFMSSNYVFWQSFVTYLNIWWKRQIFELNAFYKWIACSLKADIATFSENSLFNDVRKSSPRNRPGVAQRFPEDLGSQISMIFST
jgi:hypothetical protein